MQLEPFPVRYRRALDDDQLRRNLLAFQRAWRKTRDAAFAGIDFEAERQLLAATKDAVIADLPSFVSRFRTEAQAAGAQTYLASDADDAVRTIIGIARERGLTRIVKSKSMVSEEVGLNHGLEAAGFQVVETDLGEWIVQLAGERPSHIIAPAIHKNRRQVAELFQRATGQYVDPESIAAQVSVARGRLRQEFLAGQMGISGANALIAESGTIMLVTNEGNAELVTSLPSVHVVLAGVEKIVPSLDDAARQLQLLVPSATGAAVSAYVSWITGPDAPDRELHIVLIDNGRTSMRSSPLFDDALRCIRCGACSNVCPSYGVVGGHVFGYIYSGAIGLVNTPFHNGIEHDAGPVNLCVSCNACQTVCPVDIPLPRQILDARAWSAREVGRPAIESLALQVWSRPLLARAALRVGAVLQAPARDDDFLTIPFTRKLTEWRRLPALASKPYTSTKLTRRDARLPGSLGRTLEGLTIAYFVQCLTDWLYPSMGNATVDILTALGARVVIPRTQHCCGLPALDAGDPKTARGMARQTIETLTNVQADYVISGGTSCVIAMSAEYEHLFAEEPEWQMRAGALAARTYDITRFLLEIARLPAGSLATGVAARAAYHYFCQSYNVLGFRDEPAHVLAGMCGLDMVDLPEANVCCGFGGSVSFKQPEMCREILNRKLDNVDQAGVSLLISDNPGCIMHLRGGIAASGRAVRVAHTVEVVADHVRALKGN